MLNHLIIKWYAKQFITWSAIVLITFHRSCT